MGLDYRVRCCPDGLMTDRRHDVRVIDCTIRDGGCCNDWLFDEGLVRDSFEALVQAGVDVMEIGYQTSPGVYNESVVGPWRFSREEDLRRVARATKMKLAAMVDMNRIRIEDLRPAEDSLIDVIRIATYARDTAGAIEILHAARDLGYEVFIQVMAVTTCTPQEVDSFLELLRRSSVTNVAVVDPFGAMYTHHLRYLIRRYKNW
ncbi:MAG: nucleoid-structuring protein H-NS, partial [Proteobacteria bacterium]|nr:nucleoid-structuring protein H-NS [Pseudomonadota bacterium]